jgi:hypothetical protein
MPSLDSCDQKSFFSFPCENDNDDIDDGMETAAAGTSNSVTERDQISSLGQVVTNGCDTTERSTASSDAEFNRGSSLKYSSVLWNGQLGSLTLQMDYIQFEGLSGISITIPWHLLLDHTWSSPAATSTKSALSSADVVDAHLWLRNGEIVELLFAQNHDRYAIQQQITQRILLCHQDNNNNNTSSLVVKTLSSTTMPETTPRTVDHDVQRESFVAATKTQEQPLTLQESVVSLQSQMQELQQRESWYKAKMEELQENLDRFKTTILTGATAAGEIAAAAAGVLAAENKYNSNDDEETNPFLGGEVQFVKIISKQNDENCETSSFHDGDQEKENGGQEQHHDVVNDNNTKEDTIKGTRTHTQNRASSLTASAVGEREMDFIRTRIHPRVSTVTGQAAFANVRILAKGWSCGWKLTKCSWPATQPSSLLRASVASTTRYLWISHGGTRSQFSLLTGKCRHQRSNIDLFTHDDQYHSRWDHLPEYAWFTTQY